VVGSSATSAACSGSDSVSACARRFSLRCSISEIAAGHLRFGGLLHVEIEGRVHLQAALVDAVPPEALHELLAHLFLEVLAVGLFRAQRVGEARLAAQRLLVGRRVDRVVVAHRLEHDVAPRERAIEVDRGRVGRGRLDQAGEQRRFLDVEIAACLPKKPSDAASTP
jgi:hypothetical protein